MASSKQCTSYLEAVFRQHFKIDKSVDIMKLMEASITVVAFKHPREFEKRRKAIFGDCFGTEAIQEYHEDDGDEDGDDEEEEEDDHTVPEQVQENRDITSTSKVIEGAAANKNPKAMIDVNDEKMMQSKLERSKRNLHQMYEEIRKKKRKIQVLDLDDAPKMAPDVSSRKRFAASRFKRCY